MQSPQLQIFNAIFKVSLALGYKTYDYLPAKEASLPFVYVGEQFDVDIATKSVIYGRVTQRVHLYGDYKKRLELTGMMDSLKREIRKLSKTPNFYISVKRLNAQTLLDTTSTQPLLHGIIEIEIQFN